MNALDACLGVGEGADPSENRPDLHVSSEAELPPAAPPPPASPAPADAWSTNLQAAEPAPAEPAPAEPTSAESAPPAPSTPSRPRTLTAAENALVVETMDMVNGIAKAIRRKSRRTELEELVSIGYLALVDVVLTLDIARCAKDDMAIFRRLAAARIRHRMLNVALRAAREHARRASPRPGLGEEPERERTIEDLLDDAIGTAEDHVASAEILRILRDVEATLDEEERAFIELRFRCGLDHPATARAMEVSERTLVYRRKTILTKMRKRLQPLGITSAVPSR